MSAAPCRRRRGAQSLKRSEDTIAAQAHALEAVETVKAAAAEAAADAAAAAAAAKEKLAAAARALEGMVPAAAVDAHVARAAALERELADLRGAYAAVKDEHTRAITALRDASVAREAAAAGEAGLAEECLGRVAREIGMEVPAAGACVRGVRACPRHLVYCVRACDTGVCVCV
jgi:hypothetical protein